MRSPIHQFRSHPSSGNARTVATALLRFSLLWILLTSGAGLLKANVPGGVIPGGANVTLTDGGSTVTLSNGIVSILCDKSAATITQINYTYNNGNGVKTTQLLNGGNNGGQLYWEFGNFTGTTGDPNNAGYSIVVNPATGDANHAAGDYAEIDLLTTSSTTGTVDVHFSMLRGSPGFYVAATWSHRSVDGPEVMGETRTNIYNSPIFNWMSVDSARNKLMEIPNGTSIAVPGAPQECTLWTSGIYKGLYEDKYKNSAIFGNTHVWGYSSVGSGGDNIGLWDVSASMEYYNGGPLKRELMCQVIPDILNMFNGGHYSSDLDLTFTAGEVWDKTWGPYFVYCNTAPVSQTNEVTASQTMYNDALAQQTAEATAWPYSWFFNSNYTPASGRGAVSGQIVISDTGNPGASAANLWVDLVRQPVTSVSAYDFQQWMKPYQFWVLTGSNGNFTIPNVIAGSNYTLYAFGPGAEGTFMSQNQTGGNPPELYNLPASPFSVTVASGSTTILGAVTWKPTRAGATVFEIGYPDRTARKFRHGDDYWVGDIGSSPTAPAPVWTKFLEYPFDFPNGMTYSVGTSRWATDWDFVQPVVLNSAGAYNPSTGTIKFTIPSAPKSGVNASLYMALTSAYTGPTVVTVNGSNLGSTTGVTSTPQANSAAGFSPAYNNNDSTVREGINSMFCDERLTFPASLLKSGTNINTITITNNHGGYFADHIMYDYLRLELPGYVPPAPAGVTAYAGNKSMLVTWPVTPGATSYNIMRSTVTGTANYATVATGVTGPVCGSGTNDATWLDTGVTNGTTYYYGVQSANTTGTSAISAQSTGVAPSAAISTVAPTAPTGVTATAGDGQVSLSWTAPAGANYYTVQRSTLVSDGAGAYNTLSTIALSNTVTATSYIDPSVNNGTTYGYTIIAANASGASSVSTAADAVPLAAAPATAPTLTATPGAGEVTLNWTAVPGAVGYVIEVATSAGGPYTLIASTTELTYVDTGLANNTTYYYTVEATNSGGSSAVSSATATTPLQPPTSLTATAGNTQITLTWPAVAGASGYTIERSGVTGGPYTPVGTSVGPSYTNNGLKNGTPYYYVVASNNANGPGPVSAEATATPVATVPVAPTNLTATPGTGQVVLDWTASTGATSYVIEQSIQNGGPYTVLDASLSGTTYTSTGLTSGVTYYYVVAPIGSGGTGAYSNQASATLGIPVLTWHGAVSTAWDTTTANWQLGASSAMYVDGDGVTFDDTAATPTVVVTGSFNPATVTFNNSVLNYTLSGTNGGVMSGATGLAMSGSANLVLGGSNTFTGQTVINKGTLTLANPQALLESTLNYNNQGGTLSFGPLTSCTFGGLIGGGTLSLTNTGGGAVALAVGYSGQDTNYSGSLVGNGGSLTKTGAGTLSLTGSSSYSGATTTSGGILSVSTGAVINGSTANITGGQLVINGGSLGSSASSNITVGSGGLLVSAGAASFNGGLTTDTSVNGNVLIDATGGALNMASLFLGRAGTGLTSQPATGETTTGLYVDGGTVVISGLLQICTNGGSNSSDSVRIDSGELTVGSTTTITLNNGSRWSVLDVNGGIFSDNDIVGAGIQIGGVFAGENGIMLVRNGVANTPRITFGDGNQTSGADVLSVTGGWLYIGSGGMVAGGAGAYTSTITLSGTGTVGASANWSSPLNMTLGGDTIQAGDAFGTSHNITLSGALTGGPLTKTGNGTLLLAGPCSYAGATTVSAGILEITGTVSNTTSVSIAGGSTLYLANGSLSVSGGITNNGLFKISGTPALALTGSFINNGVLDLINGPSSLPPNLVNNGTVLNAGNVAVQAVGMTGGNFSLSIQSYLQHTYQLQRASSLTNPTWTNVGSPQAGTGSTLNFADPAAAGSQGFYQILISP